MFLETNRIYLMCVSWKKKAVSLLEMCVLMFQSCHCNPPNSSLSLVCMTLFIPLCVNETQWSHNEALHHTGAAATITWDKINTVNEPIILHPGKFHDNGLVSPSPCDLSCVTSPNPTETHTFVCKPANAKVSSLFAPWRKKK